MSESLTDEEERVLFEALSEHAAVMRSMGADEEVEVTEELMERFGA